MTQTTPDHEIAAAALSNHRDGILKQWKDQLLQEIPRAQDHAEPVIINTLPAFLDNLVQTLLPEYPRALATEGSTIAQEHGGERARLTNFKPSDIMKEYEILREIVFQTIKRECSISDNTENLIRRSFDRAMAESVTSYLMISSSLRQMISLTLGHDLRTPLSAALGNAQLIERKANDPEKVKKYAQNVVNSLRRMDQMITDLLDTQSLQLGEKLRISGEEVRLKELIETTVQQLSPDRTDMIRIEGKDLLAFCERKSIMRAVENLITNALKYGDASQPVTITLDSCHGNALISIHNHGNAIPPHEQETLFRAFGRSRGSRDQEVEGWGLGLMQVRTAVENHGGSVVVDSSPERGTTFVINMPLDFRKLS